MPFFDSLMGMLGSPDPLDEMKDYQKRQNAANNAAAGPSAFIPPGGPNAAPPVSTLPPGQEPQGTKTPEDMGSIIIDLTRREQAKQGFNQALGMGFGAFAQPRDREAVDKMFNVAPIDAQKLGEGLMQINSQQQGQNQMNTALSLANDPDRLRAAAGALHMDPNLLAQLIKTDPNKAAQLIASAATPTDALKNLGQLDYYGDQVSKIPGANPSDVEAIKSGIKAGIAGDRMAPMIQAQIAWRQTHAGKDPPWAPNNITSYEQFVANEKSKESDRGDAAKTLAENQNSAEELRGNLQTLRDSPGLKSILSDQVKREAAKEALKNGDEVKDIVARGVLTFDEANTVALLRKIGGASTSTALHSLVGTGTRVTQQEVGPLTSAISSTMDLNQDYDHYIHGAVNPFITKIKKTIANAYGASGNLKHMDPEYEPWLHSTYRKDGELYKEGGGAEAIPDLQPLPDGKLSWLKKEVASYPSGADDALDSLQQEGYDVSKLRKTDPSKW